MGRIKYPRTFLNIRKQLFPSLNEQGESHETVGLIECEVDLEAALKAKIDTLKKVANEAFEKGWPKIPDDELNNFKDINRIRIKAGTKIYRIIGLDNFRGNYWLKTVPRSELEFRRDYAVLKNWNGNGGYIEIEVKTEILAYEGSAFFQKVTLGKTYILQGGCTQIWFPSGDHFLFDLKFMEGKIKPTCW